MLYEYIYEQIIKIYSYYYFVTNMYIQKVYIKNMFGGFM